MSKTERALVSRARKIIAAAEKLAAHGEAKNRHFHTAKASLESAIAHFNAAAKAVEEA